MGEMVGCMGICGDMWGYVGFRVLASTVWVHI